MWVLISVVVVILLLALYLRRRGTSGVAGNVRTTGETAAWMEARYDDNRKH